MSLRTNLVWDAAAEPNLGIEFPLSEHWSIGANAGIKAWPRWLAWDWDQTNTKHWRNFAVVPEARYYFDQVYDGWFVGGDFVYTHFNVGNIQFPFGLYPEAKENRLQGSFWGVGLFGGHSWWLWEHWRLELEAGAALGLAAYGRYDCAHCGTKLAEERKPALVPKLGVNVAYNPVARSKRKPRGSEVVVSGTDTITVMTPPVAFVVHLKDVEAPETTGDRLSREESWVIPIGNYRPWNYLTRPGRDSLLNVQFPLDSWELKRELGHNARVLDRMESVARQIKADERTSEMLLSIVGLASIEGPQERNDSLSVRRARAVADYLAQRTGLAHRQFEIIGRGEAWDWFGAQLQAIPDGGEGLSAAQVAKLSDIVNNVPDADERERQIKADAPLYRLVKDKLLAHQRNSSYMRVYYNNAPDPVTEQYNGQVLPLLNAKRYHDAVRLLSANPQLRERALSNAEAANAYGIALYFTALDNKDARAEEEALEFLHKAARSGSEAATQNLKGIEIYGPARKEYEAWKELIQQN